MGAEIADAEIGEGAQLLVLGDMGIGNTTPSSALIAASLGLDAEQVVGRGTGIDDAAHARKIEVIALALARTVDEHKRVEDPVQRLAALGSADLAVGAGFLVEAARRGVPVLLDGVIACAEALVAADLAPGCRGVVPGRAPLARAGSVPCPGGFSDSSPSSISAFASGRAPARWRPSRWSALRPC